MQWSTAELFLAVSIEIDDAMIFQKFAKENVSISMSFVF